MKHPLNRFPAYLSKRTTGMGRPGSKPKTSPKAEESEMPKIAVRKNSTKTPKPTVTVTDEYVVVDHPKNLEVLPAGHYAVRVGSSRCNGVEISINDQPWQSCRHAVGYWWFDWHGFATGTHQLVARMQKPNGEYLISKRRRCKVV